MANQVENIAVTVVDELFAEFNEALRLTGRMNFELLQHCPEAHQRELRALMNVASLAYFALEPERHALHEKERLAS